MRPINLIPPEDRRGDSAPSRAGNLSYVVVAILAVAVAVVAATTHYGNQITENQSRIDEIEGQVEVANARAASLSSFTSFQELRDSRVATIDALAQTRFNWERVLRELTRVIPANVAVTNVTGTATPAVTVPDEAGISLRDTVAGPALEILGCSRGQRNVARFIASIHDIDGVTRVTASEGVRDDPTTDETTEVTPTAPTSGVCGREGDSKFEIVVAFDSIPVPVGALPTDPAAAVPVTSPAAPTTAVPEAEAAQASQQQDINNAANSAESATNVNPAG